MEVTNRYDFLEGKTKSSLHLVSTSVSNLWLEQAAECTNVRGGKLLLITSYNPQTTPCLMHWVNFPFKHHWRLKALWFYDPEYYVSLTNVLIFNLCNMIILFSNPWRVVFESQLLSILSCFCRDIYSNLWHLIIHWTYFHGTWKGNAKYMPYTKYFLLIEFLAFVT